MPRIARKKSDSNFHHIIVQGINKNYIFNKSELMRKYLQIILNKKEKCKVTILAYCIMNNHAHFLIHSEKIEYSSYNEFLREKMIINDDSMKLIFGKTKDYKKEFEIIHNTKNSDDLEFEDIKHKDIIDFVKEIEKKYKKNIKELKQDKNIFRQFIQDARNETDVTLTELADILDLSKSTIHNYHKKK